VARSEASPARHVRRIPVRQPLAWLAAGWRDLRRVPGPSLLHGVFVTCGGWAIVAVTLRLWQLLPGALSGFVLVGSILATGLYELSRLLAAGVRPGLSDVLAAWRRGTRPLVWLGAGLGVAATLWVALTATLLGVFGHGQPQGLLDAVRLLVASESAALFPLWLMLGGLGASVVFMVTVVSVPLLLDRHVSLPWAVRASVLAVAENPIAMGLWASLIMLATALSMASLMLGFLVAIPVIGHATWHAYRDLIDADGLPRRP
jgi:uncharacterized membrane protein